MIKARKVSREVYQIVSDCQTGIVHSVFNSSFNLSFGERLIHIGAIDKGLSPFSIGIDPQIASLFTSQIVQNTSVNWDVGNKVFRFTNGLTLSLVDALPIEQFIVKQPIDYRILRENAKYIGGQILSQNWQAGLIDSIESKRALITYLLSESMIETDEAYILQMHQLEKLVENNETIEATSVFDYWIGRGPGLTPSGDDILTGLCASLSMQGIFPDRFKQQLDVYLLEFGKQRTTVVACEYLLYTVKGLNHSYIVDMCLALPYMNDIAFKLCVAHMKEIGHTSGTDTLIGMLLGIKIGLNMAI